MFGGTLFVLSPPMRIPIRRNEQAATHAAKRRQRTPDGHESRESVSHETRAKHEQGDGGGEAAQRKAQKDSLEHISHVT